MMVKSGGRDPEFIMKVLDNTERRGRLGTPIKILFGRNVKGPMPNSNNEELDIQENFQNRIPKAEKVTGREGHFNRETFLEGDEVWIQNPINRQWDKTGTVTKVQKWNDTLLSYVVKCDGKEYLRNGKSL